MIERILLILCAAFFTIGCVFFVGCDTTEAKDTDQWEYEKNLTSAQLQSEIARAKKNGYGDDTYCFNVCKVLTVPSNNDEYNAWSRVSLCRIDICHSTQLCTKGIQGLMDRVGGCTESYPPAALPVEQDEIVPESSDAVIESSETVPESDTSTEPESSSSDEISSGSAEESSSSSDDIVDIQTDPSLTTCSACW